ncbi:hypothetical protein [Kouleothrix sp.]|uniref:hypothetical protein n=1 Tax=Kouleothrix sp. TaxID=2779161 RepID=UPI00391DE311
MSHPHLTATAHIITDAERVLRLLIETSDKPGALEIVPGRTRLDAEGAPTHDIEMLMWTKDMSDEQRASLPHKRKFLFVDPTQPTTIAAALHYARDMRDRYGNVYFGRCLYEPDHKGKYRRDQRFAIPNRLVFVDDVKPEDGHDFAIYIQTSETSGHAYKVLDRSLNAVQYADTARRLAAHYGGDASGVDYVQLGRWPNTINTKGQAGCEGYRVRLMRFMPEQVETLEAIRAAYPQPESLGGSTHAPRHSGAAPGDWRGLPDGLALITSGRWRWMCEHRPQIKMLLIKHEPVITYRKTGQADTTPSAQRAALVSNLLQLHCPPPLAEIRAVALALKPHIGADLTDEQYRAAIDREIVTYLHTHYTAKGKDYCPTPTIGIKAAPAEPRPRGRPYTAEQSRAAQLDRLRTILLSLPTNDYGVITPSATAIAAELGKSARMVRNYLHDLAEREEINFAASGKGRQLSIILLDRFGKPKQPEREKEIKSAPDQPIEAPILRIATAEAPIAPLLPHESTGDQGVYVPPPTREAVSDFQPTEQALTPAEAIAEAFDALDGCKQVTLSRIRRYLAANYPSLAIYPARLVRLVAEERTRRRYAKSDAREARKASKMGLAALQRRSRALAAQVAAIERTLKTGIELPQVLEFEYNGKTYKTRAPKTPTLRYAGYIRHLAGIYAAEEARRQPEIELTTHELWAQVDKQAYAEARKHIKMTRRGPIVVNMPEPKPGAEPEASLADSLIARLRARQAAQQVAL